MVRRLEARVAESPDARSLALLGLGYQQLARETGDVSWLARSGEALQRARSADPADGLGLAASAQLAVTRHRFREGALLARRALAHDRNDALALAPLGDALVALGRHREAFRTYDRLAARRPSVGAYARIATARQLLGRPAAALDAMELAIEAGSGIPEQQAWALTRYATPPRRIGSPGRGGECPAARASPRSGLRPCRGGPRACRGGSRRLRRGSGAA